MIEYRTERVSPQNEQGVVNVMQRFGWTLVDAQELYNEDTRIVGAKTRVRGMGEGFVGSFADGLHFGGSLHDAETTYDTVKEVTHFVSLRFARDTEMENYQELSELQQEYEGALNSYRSDKKPIKRTVIFAVGTLLILISVINAIINKVTAEPWEILVSIGFFLVMLPLVIIGWKTYRNNIYWNSGVEKRITDIAVKLDSLQ